MINNTINKIHNKLLSSKISKKKADVVKWNENSPFEFGLNKEKRDEKVILSMTSFTKRFETIHICLKSLINQSFKADKIIVWFGSDVKPESITDEMKNLEQYGVEYRFVEDNLKPHKKYFYAMQEYSDCCIITVDDDVVYSADMVESLIKTHKKYPDAVCARRVHYMTFNKEGNLLPYNDWIYECRRIKKPSFNLIPTGVGGVLYPANIFKSIAFDREKIISTCLDADDIWLKFMELIHKVPVVWVKCLLIEPSVIDSAQKVSLHSTNVTKNKNDIYIENMIKEYPESISILKK